ncbi:anaerobic ribonucleoside-triphosphate reductase activating protein [Acetanaerobacterium elongatum]|uniref:Pyruvate formate lyase activating enzyme n=1 Tax=Acetanaerobacterium elongatum TaxID=258515 RepID=A0A1H0GI53_9FIRM|nr:anaerobic ribonucleoside-triphosphate reductase activating protein [Acetanaerobacterium elongatum]SDO06441.1 pyruvate formate lyase activating enzyme [Acetanaerobacterium elongatum]
MTVAGLIKSSLVDFPGQVSCVLFLPRCNLDCFYCHNRFLLEEVPPAINPLEIEAFLTKRAGLLDGVVITGGEPLLQPDLEDFIRFIKSFGYKVKLDTNGTLPQRLKPIVEKQLCDYYAVDYKAPKARYPEICGKGADGDAVLKTIQLLQESGADFEVRTTVIPQLSLSDLVQMSEELPLLPRYVLNRYRPPERYPEAEINRIMQRPYTQAELETFVQELKRLQPNIVS